MADSAGFTQRSFDRGSAAGLRASGTGTAPVGEVVKDMAGEVVGAVREAAGSFLDEQRQRAADEVAALAGILRRSAQGLEPQGATAVSRYADEAAQELRRFADTVRHRSWNALAADVESFARRFPVGFLMAALGVGFVASRFLSASARPAGREPVRPAAAGAAAPALGTAASAACGIADVREIR